MQFMLWGGFLAFVAAMMAFDLGLLNRSERTPSTRRAIIVTAGLFALACGFAGFLWRAYDQHWFDAGAAVTRPDGSVVRPALAGAEAAGQFLAGYLLELSLSADNVFVIFLIFQFFRIPEEFQRRALFWGVLGAVVLRGVMIVAGAALVAKFSWLLAALGAFLIWTALKMLRLDSDDINPEDNLFIRWARRVYPISPRLDAERFFVVGEDGRRAATPLFLALLAVETTDVVFAIDSIPAIFGVTRDPFIVFSSNIFAILGLRSLFLALARMVSAFHLLKYFLCVLLALIGAKMIASEVFGWHPPTAWTLALVAGCLGGGVAASLLRPAPADSGQAPDGT